MDRRFFDGVYTINVYYDRLFWRPSLPHDPLPLEDGFVCPEYRRPPRSVTGDVAYTLSGEVSPLPPGEERNRFIRESNLPFHRERLDVLFRWLCLFPAAFRMSCGLLLGSLPVPSPRRSRGGPILAHASEAVRPEAAGSLSAAADAAVGAAISSFGEGNRPSAGAVSALPDVTPLPSLPSVGPTIAPAEAVCGDGAKRATAAVEGCARASSADASPQSAQAARIDLNAAASDDEPDEAGAARQKRDRAVEGVPKEESEEDSDDDDDDDGDDDDGTEDVVFNADGEMLTGADHPDVDYCRDFTGRDA